jgi:hypothetical protein
MKRPAHGKIKVITNLLKMRALKKNMETRVFLSQSSQAAGYTEHLSRFMYLQFEQRKEKIISTSPGSA